MPFKGLKVIKLTKSQLEQLDDLAELLTPDADGEGKPSMCLANVWLSTLNKAQLGRVEVFVVPYDDGLKIIDIIHREEDKK